MDTLQKIFDNMLHEQFSTAKLGLKLIERQLKAKGILLTDEQRTHLEAKLNNLSDSDTVTIEIDDEQLANSEYKTDGTTSNISLRIDLQDGLDEFLSEFEEALSQAYQDVIPQTADIMLSALKRDTAAMPQDKRAERTEFETRLQQRWHEAFDLMEMFYAIALEAGDTFNSNIQNETGEPKDALFAVMIRLHARACQVYAEVFSLLRAGFADGAHARWRTLHEIVVVAFFVKKFGNEVAERYLLHNTVESRNAAQKYQIYCARLGYEPYTEQEIARLEEQYQQLIQRFGKPFKSSYGWAAEAVGNPKPTFDQIEQAVQMDHWRPYYKLASHGVHANPKGVLFKLGLYRERPEVLLAGPSDTGFADPGHGAAISLAQITTTLLTLRPNLDRLVTCQILFKIEKEIGDTLLRIQNTQSAK